jgi:hypothetical protein
VKTKTAIFFDWQGVVHKEFAPEGQTVNSEFYKEVAGRQGFGALGRTCLRKLLQHDNAPSHNATLKQLLTKKGVTVVYHPLTRLIRHLRTTFYSLQ